MSAILDGKVALVTGSSTGLGRAIVNELAAAGATGAGLDIERHDAGLPRGWIDIRGDITNESDVRSAVTRVSEASGRLDIVVANAGLVPPCGGQMR